MRPGLRQAVVLGLLVALVACAAWNDDRPRPTESKNPLDEQLAIRTQRYTEVEQTSAAQLARDLAGAKADFALQPNPEHWRRLVFLALLPQTSEMDRELAFDLLQTGPRPVDRASGDALYMVSEDLIGDYLQLRLEAQESRETQMARAQLIDELETQLKRLTVAHKRLAHEKMLFAEQLRKEQARSRTLQHQLDEITRIEKTLEDRTHTAPAELIEDNDPAKR